MAYLVPMQVLVRALYSSGLTDHMDPIERRKTALRLRAAIAAAYASESGWLAVEDGTHTPAVDDFGNQYLVRKDMDDTCHNCGQKMIVAQIGGRAEQGDAGER